MSTAKPPPPELVTSARQNLYFELESTLYKAALLVATRAPAAVRDAIGDPLLRADAIREQLNIVGWPDEPIPTEMDVQALTQAMQMRSEREVASSPPNDESLTLKWIGGGA